MQALWKAWKGPVKKRQRVRQFSAIATWIRLVPVCFAFSLGKAFFGSSRVPWTPYRLQSPSLQCCMSRWFCHLEGSFLQGGMTVSGCDVDAVDERLEEPTAPNTTKAWSTNPS
ncbi:hypothetical protein BDW42DRAFT_178258, partial [Aspergillus taichungensis]